MSPLTGAERHDGILVVLHGKALQHILNGYEELGDSDFRRKDHRIRGLKFDGGSIHFHFHYFKKEKQKSQMMG